MTHLLSRKQLYFLFGAFVIGGLLRFYDLNWDSGFYFHPDERNIANAVMKVRFFDHLNPEFFAYGGLVIYLYRATGEVLVRLTHNPEWVSEWGHINLIGRYFSALFSTLTIIPLFLLARQLFEARVAAIATAFYVFCVASIQNAHYSTTESFLALCVVTLGLLCIRLVEQPSARLYLAIAVVQGLALGAKTSALSFYVFPLAAQAIVLFQNRERFRQYCGLFLMAMAGSVVISLLVSPYTLLDWENFKASMQYESGVVRGTVWVPYIEQFYNTPIYWFPIKNLFWQMGPVVPFCVLGVLLLGVQAVRERDWRPALLLSFPIIYFLYIGALHAKFVRYMVPIIPFLLVAGGYFLWWMVKQTDSAKEWGGKALTGAAVALTALWALAFCSIYTQEQSRIAASRWVYGNVLANSKILGENWDDRMPIYLPGEPMVNYRIEALQVFDGARGDQNIATKREYFAGQLASADYVIFATRRLHGTLPHRTKEYPLSSRYYRLMFNGELGYRKVAEFENYPRLLGLVINDDASEETFQVFDHPKVMIYQNTQRLSAEEIKKRLSEAMGGL